VLFAWFGSLPFAIFLISSVSREEVLPSLGRRTLAQTQQHEMHKATGPAGIYSIMNPLSAS
jgi:hypothetical protein